MPSCGSDENRFESQKTPNVVLETPTSDSKKAAFEFICFKGELNELKQAQGNSNYYEYMKILSERSQKCAPSKSESTEIIKYMEGKS